MAIHSSDDLLLHPRASGTRLMVDRDAGHGAVAVFVDDHVTRRKICDRVRHHAFFALPATTGLDAVLVLERAGPRTAIVASTALGAPAHQILDFLEQEYPATERVLLGGRMNAWLAEHVSEWARDLVELDTILDHLHARLR